MLPTTHRRTCCYCGNPAECREHFRPWYGFNEGYWIPSCGDCNAILGRSTTETMAERCEIIRQRLYRRFACDMRRDYDSLIDGTTGMLREHLGYTAARVDNIRCRIRWLSAMIAMCDFDLADLRPGSDEASTVCLAVDRLLKAEARAASLNHN